MCSANSFVFMSSHCMSFKAIRYESFCLSRIVADKSYHVMLVYGWDYPLGFILPIPLYSCQVIVRASKR